MTVNFSIQNADQWTLDVSIQKIKNADNTCTWQSAGVVTKEAMVGWLKFTPMKVVQLEDIQFKWSDDLDKSGFHPFKILKRECKRVTSEQTCYGFEVIECDGKVTVVFGRYIERVNTFYNGLKVLGGGLSLCVAAPVVFSATVATGCGVLAAGMIGYGSTQALDAYKKDGTNFSAEENEKQSLYSGLGGMAGALVGPAAHVVGKIPAVGHVVAQLGSKVQLVAKVAQPAAASFVGHVTTKRAKGESISLKESFAAVAVGSITGAAGIGCDRVMPFAETADDLVMAVGSATMKGALCAGAANEAAHWLQNPDGKKREWSDIGFTMAVGGLASGSSKLGDVGKNLYHPAETTPANTPSTNPLEQELKALQEQSLTLQSELNAANDAWKIHRSNVDRKFGSNILKKLKHGWNGQSKSSPHLDSSKNKLLDTIAEGGSAILIPKPSSDHSSKTYSLRDGGKGAELFKNKNDALARVKANTIKQQEIQQQLDRPAASVAKSNPPFEKQPNQNGSPYTPNWIPNEAEESSEEETPPPVVQGPVLGAMPIISPPVAQPPVQIVPLPVVAPPVHNTPPPVVVQNRPFKQSNLKQQKELEKRQLGNKLIRLENILIKKRNESIKTKDLALKQELKEEIAILQKEWFDLFMQKVHLN